MFVYLFLFFEFLFLSVLAFVWCSVLCRCLCSGFSIV